MNSRTTAKIEALTALINHAKTGADERDAAKRALVRIRRALADVGQVDSSTPEGRWYYTANAWEGSRYAECRHLGLAEIARLMREDLKLARKVVNAPTTGADVALADDPFAGVPAQIKISIRSEYFSGGGAIRIKIKNVPAEWGWTEQDSGDDLNFGYDRKVQIKVATPAFAAFRRAVEEIHQSYNFDDSDAQVDYFHKNFYGQVDTEERVHFPRSWERAA
jgi:hypothetical protein